MIRTNLSSFWNIPHLCNDILPTLNRTNVATGIGVWNQFISGTGVIVSNDVCKRICQQELSGDQDDVVLSRVLSTITTLQFLPESKMYYLIHGANNVIPDDVSSILYFRVKSSINPDERHYDETAFRYLLKKIYDIDYTL